MKDINELEFYRGYDVMGGEGTLTEIIESINANPERLVLERPDQITQEDYDKVIKAEPEVVLITQLQEHFTNTEIETGNLDLYSVEPLVIFVF